MGFFNYLAWPWVYDLESEKNCGLINYTLATLIGVGRGLERLCALLRTKLLKGKNGLRDHGTIVKIYSIPTHAKSIFSHTILDYL